MLAGLINFKILLDYINEIYFTLMNQLIRIKKTLESIRNFNTITT